MRIKLKEAVSIKKMNELLEGMSLPQRFNTEEDTLEWLEDINNNPNSPQKHLKPQDRNLSIDELKSMFKVWTENGLMDVDIHFGRTPLDEMQGLANFIVQNKENIEYITEGELLIERGELEENIDVVPVLIFLEKEKEEIKLLPKEVIEKQRELQGGLLLCKGWGNEPFWLIFGSTPEKNYDVRFLKEKKYVDPGYNGLYKDDNGRAYMLMPLNDFSPDFFETVYANAYEIGLREHPSYIAVMVYGYALSDFKLVAESLTEMYSVDELEERFKKAIERINSTGLRVTFNDRKGLIQSKAIYDVNRGGKESLINAMYFALQETYGKIEHGIEDGDNYKFVFKNHEITVKNRSWQIFKELDQIGLAPFFCYSYSYKVVFRSSMYSSVGFRRKTFTGAKVSEFSLYLSQIRTSSETRDKIFPIKTSTPYQ